MRTGDLSIYTACVEVRSLTSVIGSIRGRIWAFLMKSNSQPTQKTQVLQLENAEHPQDLNSCCKWDTSLPFLGQQLYFCQAATHLQRDCSLSDHTVGIIKKLGYQESLWVQLIRQQRSVPAQFCPKYTCSDNITQSVTQLRPRWISFHWIYHRGLCICILQDLTENSWCRPDDPLWARALETARRKNSQFTAVEKREASQRLIMTIY